MSQIKEQNKSSETPCRKKLYDLPDRLLKIAVIITEVKRKMCEQGENVNRVRKYFFEYKTEIIELKNTITELKNSPEGLKNRLE